VADPERGWINRDIDLEGRRVPADEEVWVHRRGDSWTEIEFKGRRGRVPSDAINDHPVHRPSLAQLRELDSCFGLDDDAFEQKYIDKENFFTIVTCRAHGRRFLVDTVTYSFVWGTRTTLLTDDDADDPAEVWRRYHGQTDAWHARRGRSY
jgi:hypothetical protein